MTLLNYIILDLYIKDNVLWAYIEIYIVLDLCLI